MLFFNHFFLNLPLKCAFTNILLISFIFNFKFMFCIIAIDLIVVDFRFYLFRLEICKIYIKQSCIFALKHVFEYNFRQEE